MRAIRGAITVDENTEKGILEASGLLFKEIVEKNHLSEEEIVSIIFSVTPDLDAVYPARAIREMGYKNIPLFDVAEMYVKGSLPRVIRVLVFVNRDTPLDNMVHVYLRDAKKLRPDLVKGEKR